MSIASAGLIELLAYIDANPRDLWSPSLHELTEGEIVVSMHNGFPRFRMLTKQLAQWSAELYRRNIAVDRTKMVAGGMVQLSKASGCDLDLIDEIFINPFYENAISWFVRPWTSEEWLAMGVDWSEARFIAYSTGDDYPI